MKFTNKDYNLIGLFILIISCVCPPIIPILLSVVMIILISDYIHCGNKPISKKKKAIGCTTLILSITLAIIIYVLFVICFIKIVIVDTIHTINNELTKPRFTEKEAETLGCNLHGLYRLFLGR